MRGGRKFIKVWKEYILTCLWDCTWRSEAAVASAQTRGNGLHSGSQQTPANWKLNVACILLANNRLKNLKTENTPSTVAIKASIKLPSLVFRFLYQLAPSVSQPIMTVYVIQQCFICCLSDFTVSEDARIEERTAMTLTLTARRSNYLARYHPQHSKFQPMTAN